MQRIIREEDPPRPSTRVAASHETLSSVANHRSMVESRVAGAIKGELDWIVMKAIEKARHRRYESAAALGADLGRYLSGDAVLAAPPSAIYVATKFVRRHRALATTVSLVAIALVVGLIATSLALTRALRAESEERRLRGVAQSAQETEAALRIDADRQRDEAVARSDEANISAAAAAIALHEPAAARRRLELCPPERRGWEWRWLDAACDDALVTCRHTDRVTHAAFSPDGRTIALRGVDRRMAVYDLPGGQEIRSFGSGDDRLGQVAFSPDGSEIAAGTQDGEVTIFRVDTGHARLVLPMPLPQYPATLIFSADGKRLLCQGTGSDLRCVDAANGAVLAGFPTRGILGVTARGIRIAGVRAGTTCEILDDTGSRLATFDASLGRPILFDDLGARLLLSTKDASDRPSLRVVDATTGVRVSEFVSPPPLGDVRHFSPDGSLFAMTGSEVGTRVWPTVWDVRSGTLLATLKGHTQPGLGLRFSLDGTMLLTWAADRTVVVWRAADGERLATLFGHGDTIVEAFFSPDGTRVVSVSHDRTVRQHEIATGAEVSIWTGIERFVALCAQMPDPRFLLTSSDEGAVRLWDIESGASPVVLRASGPCERLFITRGGDGEERLVLRNQKDVVTLFDPRTGRGEPFPTQMRGLTLAPCGRLAIGIPKDVLTFLDGRSGETIASIPGGGATHTFSDDGTRVAFPIDGNDVAVYATEPFAPILRLKGAGTDVHHLRFAGDRLLTLSRKGPMVVWDLTTGARIATHETGVTKHPPFLIEIAPDGRHAVMGGLSAPLRVVDLASQTVIEPKVEGDSALHGVITVSFSADSQRYAAASQDYLVRVFRVGESAPALTLVGHTGPAHGVAFHPSEPRLATSGWDQTVRLWDADTGREVAVLAGHSGPVHAVRFSVDGKRLYSASADSTVRVWDTVPKRQRDGSTWDPTAVKAWQGRSIRTETIPY